MKIVTVMCSCGGTLNNIEWNEIKEFMEENQRNPDDYILFHENLCGNEGKDFVRDIHNNQKPDAIVFGACTPKTAGYLFQDVTKELGFSPFSIVGANLREQVSWVTTDQNQATQKAKGLLLAAYNKASYETQVEQHTIPMTKSALIIGAGPSGIQASQDLAERGIQVHLIDKNDYIGGNATKLSMFFPSDDCAACLPTVGIKGVHQSNVRRCFYRSGFDLNPYIDLHLRSEVIDLSGVLGNYKALVKTKPTYVDINKCVNCHLCSQRCPVEVPDDQNLGLTTRKAIYMPNITAYSTKYVINREECLEGCTECVKYCPVSAIDLDQQEKTQELEAGGIVIATGFREYNPRLIDEYHYGEPGFQNVITQSELARFIDITGPTTGYVKKKNRDPVYNLVMIACAGSRSQKYNIWCSNICCMIGLKHAIAIKERQPEINVTMCYIDIRAVGPDHEEYYTRARQLGVKFIRGRPAEIESDGEYLYVHVEDSQADKLVQLKADMVVLSMAMVPNPGIQELSEKMNLAVDKAGYFKELYSKLRTTETKQAGIFAAGAAIAPSDIPTSVTRAAQAANQLSSLLEKDSITKRFPTATIIEEKCTKCELCVTACPYGAIEVLVAANPGMTIQINPITCLGCGQCSSSCPTAAININYYQERQIMDQVKGTLFDANESPDPIVITFACWECAYSSIDYIGQMSISNPEIQYPHNIRVVPVQCTGDLSARMIQETFTLGAEGVIVAGCYEDRCHYVSGSTASTHRVNLMRTILEQSGIDKRRLKKSFIFCSSSDNFVATSRRMIETLKEIGKLERN
ncbi:MAG: hydrogenase iron-sulfur subunit [Candidatus Hodarchaeales archaeon]|jgi:heterodisulfide reductase subunit A